ncbi:MAG: hypothetical protein ABL934_09725 [Lysobacteraceae bacterium]
MTDDIDDELPPSIGTRFRDMGREHIERYPPTEHHALRDGLTSPAATGTDAPKD